MLGIALSLLVVDQLPRVYHFRTLEVAQGQQVWPQAPAPPSPMTAKHRDDPYGFTKWVNDTRLMYGLGPIVYDRDLEQWGVRNNAVQRHKGLGPHVLGPARVQNTAVITGEISPYVGFEWMDSPGPRRALLNPTITRFGLAWDGLYWTWNAR